MIQSRKLVCSPRVLRCWPYPLPHFRRSAFLRAPSCTHCGERAVSVAQGLEWVRFFQCDGTETPRHPPLKLGELQRL